MTDYKAPRLPTRGERHILQFVARVRYALLATVDTSDLYTGRYCLVAREYVGPGERPRQLRIVASYKAAVIHGLAEAGWIERRDGEWVITTAGIAAKDGEVSEG